MEEDVLRNFTKFTGKQMGQSLFFNKVTGLRPATLLKKRLWHRTPLDDCFCTGPSNVLFAVANVSEFNGSLIKTHLT